MITLHCSDWNTHELCKMEGCDCKCHKSVRMVFFTTFFCCGYFAFYYDPLAAILEHWQKRHPQVYMEFTAKCYSIIAGGKI